MRPQPIMPFTREEHSEMGVEIRATVRRLEELTEVVASIYGPQSRAAFGFLRTMEALERLQREMQAQAELDLPGESVEGLYV